MSNQNTHELHQSNEQKVIVLSIKDMVSPPQHTTDFKHFNFKLLISSAENERSV
jgi:hypothetical protein